MPFGEQREETVAGEQEQRGDDPFARATWAVDPALGAQVHSVYPFPGSQRAPPAAVEGDRLVLDPLVPQPELAGPAAALMSRMTDAVELASGEGARLAIGRSSVYGTAEIRQRDIQQEAACCQNGERRDSGRLTSRSGTGHDCHTGSGTAHVQVGAWAPADVGLLCRTIAITMGRVTTAL